VSVNTLTHEMKMHESQKKAFPKLQNSTLILKIKRLQDVPKLESRFPKLVFSRSLKRCDVMGRIPMLCIFKNRNDFMLTYRFTPTYRHNISPTFQGVGLSTLVNFRHDLGS